MFFRNYILFFLTSYVQINMESGAETLDDVVADCQSHIQRRVVCFGFTEEMRKVVAKNSCVLRRGQCSMWLRVKIAQGKGEWNPTLKITYAIVHSQKYTNKIYQGFIRIVMENSRNFSYIFAQRYTSGKGRIHASTYFGGWTSENELWTDSASLVFSFYMPAIVRISGKERYTFSTFQEVTLFHGPELTSEPSSTDRTFTFTARELELIVNFSGFKYVGCGQNNFLCLSLTRTAQETENCFKWSNCSEFVRLASTSDNWTLVYVKRELSAASTGYISVGFSTEQSMGRALVFDCIKEQSTIRGQISYNEGHQNLMFPLVVDSNHMMSHNYFECFWNIPSTATVGTERFAVNLGLGGYYIVWAFGDFSLKVEGKRKGAYGKLKHIAAGFTVKRIRFTSGQIEEVSGVKVIETDYFNYSPFWIIIILASVLWTATGVCFYLSMSQRKRRQKLRKKLGPKRVLGSKKKSQKKRSNVQKQQSKRPVQKVKKPI